MKKCRILVLSVVIDTKQYYHKCNEGINHAEPEVTRSKDKGRKVHDVRQKEKWIKKYSNW